MADARRIADLERQLAEAKSQQTPQPAAGQAPDVFAVRQRFNPDTGNPYEAMGRAHAEPQDTRLADAPRRVPVRFILAELLPFRWWYLFAMFMVAIPPIALWMNYPELLAPAAVATLVVIYGFQFWTGRTRLGLLTWGRRRPGHRQ